MVISHYESTMNHYIFQPLLAMLNLRRIMPWAQVCFLSRDTSVAKVWNAFRKQLACHNFAVNTSLSQHTSLNICWSDRILSVHMGSDVIVGPISRRPWVPMDPLRLAVSEERSSQRSRSLRLLQSLERQDTTKVPWWSFQQEISGWSNAWWILVIGSPKWRLVHQVMDGFLMKRHYYPLLTHIKW